MTVEAYIWSEIIRNFLLITLLLFFITCTVFSIRADIEKRKAYKGLQKGFHVEFINIDNDKSNIDLEKVAAEISKRLKKTVH